MTILATLASRVESGASLRAAAVLFAAVLTAAAAQISVPLPFTPVPFTLQPLVVLLAGAALGSRLALTSQLLYLAAGAAGLPVFAASPALPQGFARLIGPTGGYLMSYPIAAFVAGLLAERGFDRRYLTSVAAMAAGLLIVFAGGVSWLSLFTPGPDPVLTAVRTGFLPFVPADILKILVGATVLPQAWKFLGTRHLT